MRDKHARNGSHIGREPMDDVAHFAIPPECVVAARILARIPQDRWPYALFYMMRSFCDGFVLGRFMEIKRRLERLPDTTRAQNDRTQRRIAAWREELEKERQPDGRLRRGAITRVARLLAERFGTNADAERRFYYREVESP